MYIHVKCTIHLFTLQFKWYKWSTGTGTSNYLSNKCCLWWFIQIKRGSKLCIKNELYNIFAAIKAFIVYIYICLLKFSYITVELPLFVFAQFLWIFFLDTPHPRIDIPNELWNTFKCIYLQVNPYSHIPLNLKNPCIENLQNIFPHKFKWIHSIHVKKLTELRNKKILKC